MCSVVYAHWAIGRGLDRVVGAAQIGSGNTSRRARARCRGHALDGLLVDDRPAEPPALGRRCIGHGCGCVCGGRHGAGKVNGARRLRLFFKNLRERASDALATGSRRGRGAIEADSSCSALLDRRCAAVDVLEAGGAAVAGWRYLLGDGRDRRDNGTDSAGRRVAKRALGHRRRAGAALDELRALGAARGVG